MKRMIATVIAGVAIAAGTAMHAQDRTNAHLVKAEGVGQAASVQLNCNVNGVVYPVDFANNIWAINPATRLWFIIGHLYATTAGFVAVDPAGNHYPAACW